jgi:hypothetical protein
MPWQFISFIGRISRNPKTGVLTFRAKCGILLKRGTKMKKTFMCEKCKGLRADAEKEISKELNQVGINSIKGTMPDEMVNELSNSRISRFVKKAACNVTKILLASGCALHSASKRCEPDNDAGTGKCFAKAGKEKAVHNLKVQSNEVLNK